MNKKIETMAKEAGLEWALKRATVAGQPDDKESIERFAELLIRDCAKQVNHVYKQGGGTYAEVILKHFNIKIK